MTGFLLFGAPVAGRAPAQAGGGKTLGQFAAQRVGFCPSGPSMQWQAVGAPSGDGVVAQYGPVYAVVRATKSAGAQAYNDRAMTFRCRKVAPSCSQSRLIWPFPVPSAPGGARPDRIPRLAWHGQCSRKRPCPVWSPADSIITVAFEGWRQEPKEEKAEARPRLAAGQLEGVRDPFPWVSWPLPAVEQGVAGVCRDFTTSPRFAGRQPFFWPLQCSSRLNTMLV